MIGLNARSRVLAGLLFLLSSCATAPEPSERMTALQTELNTLQQQEFIQQYAPEALADAESAVAMMAALEKTDGDQDAIAHKEYIAKRKLDTAVELAKFKRAQAQWQSAQAQRMQMQPSSAQQQLNTTLAMADTMRAQAEQGFADEDRIRIKEDARGLVLALGAVQFGAGDSTLNHAAEVSLNAVAQFLKVYPQRALVVEAFTDSSGDAERNLQLSTERAQRVVNYLIHQGIAPDRIQAWGYGEAFPVASNATATGRRQNRRVELVIAYSDNTLIAERQASSE